MRVEYINPFVETSFQILKEVLGGADVNRGDLYSIEHCFKNERRNTCYF